MFRYTWIAGPYRKFSFYMVTHRGTCKIGILILGMDPEELKCILFTRHLHILESFSFVCLHFKWVKKKSRQTCLEIYLQQKEIIEKNSKC